MKEDTEDAILRLLENQSPRRELRLKFLNCGTTFTRASAPISCSGLFTSYAGASPCPEIQSIAARTLYCILKQPLAQNWHAFGIGDISLGLAKRLVIEGSLFCVAIGGRTRVRGE